jgi:hypothetical protein
VKSLTFNIPPNPVEAHKVMAGAVWKQVKAHAMAGNRIAVRICDQDKSRDAEEKYHAMVGEIAAQVEVGGRLRDAETMKRLLVDQFKADTLNDPEFADDWAKFGTVDMAPSLDGQRVVVLGTQTRHFTRKLASGFIEWLYAWGADAGVVFTERFIDPATGEIVTARRQKEAA